MRTALGGLYQKNIDFLKENCPQIWEQVKDKENGNTYTAIPAREQGMYCLEARQKDGGCMLLHSRYNPRREADMWATNCDLEGVRHVVLYGFGLGYHVEALLEKRPQLSFFIYEPDLDVFLATLGSEDWTNFPWERVSIVFEDGRDRYREFVDRVISLVKDGWVFLSIPAFERCFPERFRELAETLKSARESYIDNLYTDLVFEKEWTTNALKNIFYLVKYESIFHYKEYFQGRSVVMTASGPSLTEAIPYIRKIKDRRQALIVAAGTSVNALLKHDLIPDAFVSYDPFPANYKALQPVLSKGVPLVFGSTVNNDIVKNHVGPKAYFILSQDTVFHYLRGALDEIEIIEDAPSIAVVTLRLLDKLGVKEVILAGQDLAFVGDRYYADGVGVVRPDGVSDEEKDAAVEVESNSDRKVLASKSFIKMRKSLEQAIALSRFVRVVNTSLDGAKIAGACFVGWDEVVEQLEEWSCKESPAFRELVSTGERRRVRKKVANILSDIEDRLAAVLESTEKFLSLGEGVAEAKQQRSFEELSRRITVLTCTREYAAFIGPMIRNEDHLLKKSLGDVPYMSWEEKRNFVAKDLNRYLLGVKASLTKLKEALEQGE